MPFLIQAPNISSDTVALLTRSISSSGTFSKKSFSAVSERSRESSKSPISFSTCAIITTSPEGSASATNSMSLTNAFLSASNTDFEKGERHGLFCPPLLLTRGKRFVSRMAQCGTYPENPFFQLPNHSSTNFILRSRACEIIFSISEKSKTPSLFSICSQATARSTVFKFKSARPSQCFCMSDAVEPLEFKSSPPRTTKGFPSTTSLAVLFESRSIFGSPCDAHAATENASAHDMEILIKSKSIYPFSNVERNWASRFIAVRLPQKKPAAKLRVGIFS